MFDGCPVALRQGLKGQLWNRLVFFSERGRHQKKAGRVRRYEKGCLSVWNDPAILRAASLAWHSSDSEATKNAFFRSSMKFQLVTSPKISNVCHHDDWRV